MSGLLQIGVLAFALMAATTWLFVAFFAPTGTADARKSPRRLAFVARAWLYAPLWVPVVLLAAALAPGIAEMLLGHGDHCLLHEGHHLHHLCLAHPPHASSHPLVWMVPVGLAVPALVRLVVQARRAWRESRLARALIDTSRPSEYGDDVRMLDQDTPAALTTGWRAPRILLSTGLVARISPAALEAVVAHERAHIRRRDTLLAVVDRFAAALLPRGVAQPLLARITLARELACDAAAARATGGCLVVAQALTEVARLGIRQPAAAGVSIASCELEARVINLLDPPRDRRVWALLPVVGFVGLAVAGVGPIHGAVEHVIHFLLH